MSILIMLLVVFLLLGAIGGAPGVGWYGGGGHWGYSGGFGLVLVILLVFWFMRGGGI